MTSGNQGTNMENQEDAAKAAEAKAAAKAASKAARKAEWEKAQAAKAKEQPKNEFAPTIINNGDGTSQEINPAPTPAASMQNEAGAAAGEANEPEVEEKDFLAYVHGDLKAVAERFGYDLTIKKRNNARGPVMLYHRETREGKTFGAPEEAGPDYMSGDELQETYARERKD